MESEHSNVQIRSQKNREHTHENKGQKFRAGRLVPYNTVKQIFKQKIQECLKNKIAISKRTPLSRELKNSKRKQNFEGMTTRYTVISLRMDRETALQATTGLNQFTEPYPYQQLHGNSLY